MAKKILVVDNNPLILKLMQLHLANEGYTVLTAADGLAALAMLEEHRPEVIFTDLVMPNISGDKLCRIIRNMPQHRDVLLVILSAIAAEEQLEPARYGADACIVKGPAKKVVRNVLTLLNQARNDRAALRREGPVIGFDEVYQREITKELLASKRHYELIFANMAEGIFELARDGRIVYANPAAVAMIGLAEERLLGTAFLDLFSEEQRHGLGDRLAAAATIPSLSDDDPIELHGRSLLFNFLPIPESADQSIVVIATDITERHRARRELTTSEEKYRNFVEHSLDGICIVQDMKIRFVNQQVLKITGYREEEVLGSSFVHHIDPENILQIQKVYEAFATGKQGEFRFETGLCHKLKHRLEVECSISPTTFEGKRAALIFLRDITARRQTEEELRRAHGFLQSVIDGVSEAIVVIGSDYRIKLLNEAARRLHGVSEESDISSLRCYQLGHGRNKPCSERDHPCPLRRVSASGQPYSGLHTHVDAAGNSVPMEIHATPVLDEEGQVAGIIEVSRDMTERQRHEEKRREFEARRFQQEKEESIASLAGGIAHDFNNILTSALGSVELLRRSEALPEKEVRLVATTAEAMHRMVALTRKLQAYTNERQAVEMTLEAVNDLIRDALDMTREEGNGAIRVELELADDLWQVYADPAQMRQVLASLLTNAFEAMAGGPGTLTVASANEVIESGQECRFSQMLPAGDYVHVRVSDTGSGIPPEELKRVFEPGYTTKFIGRGLGLAAALGIVKHHRGCLSVESEPGRGATFHLMLPRARRVAPHA